MPQMSAAEINAAVERLRDPRVKYKINLASTREVARDIVDSLPGVKELKEGGPQAARAVIDLLKDENTLNDSNLTAISLRILESHPSEEVKLVLAGPISEHRFRGFNSLFAARTFLRAAQIEPTDNAVELAFEEARKLQPENAGVLNLTAAKMPAHKPSSAKKKGKLPSAYAGKVMLARKGKAKTSPKLGSHKSAGARKKSKAMKK